MTSAELQKYLSGILETELSIYTQNQLIKKLTSEYNCLGRVSKLSAPKKKKTEASWFYCVWISGIVIGILSGIIGLIDSFNSADSFIYYFAAIIAGLIIAAIGAFVGGLGVGTIVWIVWFIKDKKRISSQYSDDINNHQKRVKNQELKLKNDQKKKPILAKEINDLKACRSRSESNLSKMYSYNILAPKYRNIYAVSSILGYLRAGRTYCLQFNQSTGDQGAYNIYETEIRLDRIITNTEEILYKLDQVIDYQKELAYGLQKANQKIDSLYSNVTNHLDRISSSVNSIEQSQSLIAYNTECTKNQLALLNWMNIVY